MFKRKPRTILYSLAGTLLLFSLFQMTGCGKPDAPTLSPPKDGLAAKMLLIEGNKRYVEGNLLAKDVGKQRREEFASEQKPVAVVLACADSRVPPEMIFDQGLGQLFVIRTAGNVLDSVTLGSVEYAVEELKTPLILVLGHDNCGAVQTVAQGGIPHGSIASIVRKIQPTVDKAKRTGAVGTEVVDQAIDGNIQNTVAELKKSVIIRQALTNKGVNLESARYNMESGEVTWVGQK